MRKSTKIIDLYLNAVSAADASRKIRGIRAFVFRNHARIRKRRTPNAELSGVVATVPNRKHPRVRTRLYASSRNSPPDPAAEKSNKFLRSAFLTPHTGSSEKSFWIHGFFSAANSWKRGSFRIRSQTGSSRNSAGVIARPYGICSSRLRMATAWSASPSRA